VLAAGQQVNVTNPIVTMSGNLQIEHAKKVRIGIKVYLKVRVGIIIFLLRQVARKFCDFNVNPIQNAKNDSIGCVKFFAHKKL
jgi:hypothetical protein